MAVREKKASMVDGGLTDHQSITRVCIFMRSPRSEIRLEFIAPREHRDASLEHQGEEINALSFFVQNVIFVVGVGVKPGRSVGRTETFVRRIILLLALLHRARFDETTKHRAVPRQFLKLEHVEGKKRNNGVGLRRAQFIFIPHFVLKQRKKVRWVNPSRSSAWIGRLVVVPQRRHVGSVHVDVVIRLIHNFVFYHRLDDVFERDDAGDDAPRTGETVVRVRRHNRLGVVLDALRAVAPRISVRLCRLQ